MNNFYKSTSNLLYFFGFGSVVFILIIAANLSSWIDSQYWYFGAALLFLLLFVSISLMIIAANLKFLPVPKKFEGKSIPQILEEHKK